MENASKALLMAAGVLIGILVITLAVYLFITFGSQVKQVYDDMEQQQLLEYNAQYEIYNNRKDITIYDIISVANLAIENNNKYEGIPEYQVQVIFRTKNLTSEYEAKQQDLNLLIDDNNYAGGEIKVFKCMDGISYNSNGRVNKISFQE